MCPRFFPPVRSSSLGGAQRSRRRALSGGWLVRHSGQRTRFLRGRRYDRCFSSLSRHFHLYPRLPCLGRIASCPPPNLMTSRVCTDPVSSAAASGLPPVAAFEPVLRHT